MNDLKGRRALNERVASAGADGIKARERAGERLRFAEIGKDSGNRGMNTSAIPWCLEVSRIDQNHGVLGREHEQAVVAKLHAPERIIVTGRHRNLNEQLRIKRVGDV